LDHSATLPFYAILSQAEAFKSCIYIINQTVFSIASHKFMYTCSALFSASSALIRMRLFRYSTSKVERKFL